jgi:hypothetical protein
MVCKAVNLRKEKYDVYIGRGSKWGIYWPPERVRHLIGYGL